MVHVGGCRFEGDVEVEGSRLAGETFEVVTADGPVIAGVVQGPAAVEHTDHAGSGAREPATPDDRLPHGLSHVDVPVSVHYASISYGPEPFDSLTMFSPPPVVPGSYEPVADA